MGVLSSSQKRTIDLSIRARAELPVLRQAVIFQDLPLDVLEHLVASAHRVEVETGHELKGEWDAYDSVFVLIRGGIRVLLRSPKEREVTLSRRAPVEAFDLEFTDDEVSGEIIAEASMGGTVVYVFGWSHLLDLLAFRPHGASLLSDLLREGLMQDRRLITELAFFNIRSRLAHKLGQIAQSSLDGRITISQDQLAAEVGCRPEDVHRALRHFQEECLVNYRPHQRSVIVLHTTALAAY